MAVMMVAESGDHSGMVEVGRARASSPTQMTLGGNCHLQLPGHDATWLSSIEPWFSEGTTEECTLNKNHSRSCQMLLCGVTVDGPQFPHFKWKRPLSPFASVHSSGYFTSPECFINAAPKKEKVVCRVMASPKMPWSQSQDMRKCCLVIDTVEHSVLS